MKQNNHSLTAQKVAIMRAAHQIYDRPTIYDDPIALSILHDAGVSEIYAEKRKYKAQIHRYLRAIVIARSKFVEDELSDAVKRGIRQYVILGAGLDTFAYRNPFSSDGLKVFEVDHPATQDWKLEQLAAAKIPIPNNLLFAPIDFENQILADQLDAAGFKADKPSLFSWLGVTMYLNQQTVMTTLSYISSLTSSGSEVIFDYAIPPSSQNFLRRIVFRLISRKVNNAGEPWLCFFNPKSLIADLKGIGFTQVKDIGPNEINDKYFVNRTDKLKVGKFGHLIKAQV